MRDRIFLRTNPVARPGAWRRCGATPGLVGAVLALQPLSASALDLNWPTACTDGTDCFVQNYVDHGGSRDFTCGPLTYPGHDGTDIRLPSLAAMRSGVAVLAPADGTVLRVRDGMADRSIRAADGTPDAAALAAVAGRDCGNGVVIAHADGYESQLCHLKQGSITVRPGETVSAGAPVGAVGLSGMTEFPHVHLTLTRNGEKLDPFTGGPLATTCGAAPADALWAEPVAYRATAVLGDGFTDAPPEAAAMRDSPVSLSRLGKDAGVLAYWVDLMGLRAGDRLTLRITGPDEAVLVEDTTVIPSSKAQYFRFVGKRLRAPLPPGSYQADLRLVRDANPAPQEILRHSRTLAVE